MSSESSTSAHSATPHDARHGELERAGHGEAAHAAYGEAAHGEGAHGAQAAHGEVAHAAHGEAAHGEVAHAPVEHEQPSDWGWNGEWGKWASRGGWIVVVILLLMFAGVTHYNKAGFLAQTLVILGLVAILVWDRARKRTSWRK